MNTNQQFAVSIHVLTLLSALPDQAITSEQIANSVNTHPVVIRRIMGLLRKKGLVESRSGASGGWKLSRLPQQITLCCVYEAVNHDELLGMHSHPNTSCSVGAHIQPAIGKVFNQAEKALHTALGGFTIADVLADIQKTDARKEITTHG